MFHRCGGISAAGYLLPVPAWVGNYLKILFLVVSHTYLFIWRTRRTSRSNFWNHGIADWSASGSRMLQCLPKDCSTSHIIYLFFIKVFANMKKKLRCVQLLCVQIQSFGLLGIANQKTTRGPALRRPNCFKSWHVSRFQWKFGISVGVKMSMHRMNKIDAF